MSDIPETCRKCGLYKQGHNPEFPLPLPGDGAEYPDVLFVGEAIGCITGDSLIDTAFRDKLVYPDGVPIKGLVNNYDFYVYSYDILTESLVIGKVNKVWSVGIKPVYEVIYEWYYNKLGETIRLRNTLRVTSNHLFLLKSNVKHDPFKSVDYGNIRYVSIDTGLMPGASLQPFYRNLTTNGNYANVGSSSSNMQSEARLLLEYKLGRKLASREQCHHIDRQKLNDDWNNLCKLTVAEHAKLHCDEDGNPMQRPNARENHIAAMQSDAYRNNMSNIMSAYLSDPEVHAERLRQIESTNERRSQTVRDLFNDPHYYYKYLLGRQKCTDMDDEWVISKFRDKFPGMLLPLDNHKVISITYMGMEEVYDMDVEQYHNFAVNGIFVHNSEEFKQGKPFVGKTGQHLRNTINAADISIDKVRFTNVVRCRPPENRTPTSKEIEYCSQFLVDELEQYQARVVVLLGNTPLKAVLGYNGITSFQGTLIERDGVKYVPCYHPSYVLRQNGNVDEDWLKTFMVIEDALKDNGESASRADAHYQYLYPMSILELEQMRDELLSTDDLIACDIEAISKRISYPNNKIISIAFANSNKAWSFPIDHKDWAWTAEECVQAINIIRDILTKGKIINHLIKFDCKMIRHFLGIDFVPYGDTIQLSRLVSPQALEHGLKRLAGIHLGMFDYDEELSQYVAEHPECDYDRGGNYGNVPLEVLLPYGGLDVSATRMLHDVLYAQLTEKQRILYEQMIIQADYALGLIEENGFKLDYWVIERYWNIYQIIMDHKYKPAMLKDKHLQQSIHVGYLFEQLKKAGLLTQTKIGKKFVCEIGGAKFNKDEWHTFYLNHKKQLDELDKFPESMYEDEFNPGSAQQVYPVIYQHKKLVPENKIIKTDTGLPCIKRDILKKVVYDLGLNGKKDQFLLDYMDWKLLFSVVNKTFKAMMTSPSDWYSEDGRVHSSYTLGGAKTGRTSSSQPNVQNIPAIEKEHGTVLQYLPAKNAFTHTFDGGGLAMLDYSGMELRVMASIAGIQGMLDVFNRKGDVHRYVSSLIYKKPEDKITKDERYRGKWCNWSLLYLGDDHTLYRLYSHQGVTKEESVQITKLYFQSFPQLKQYHNRIEEFVMTNGYVESEFGRRLLLPAVHDSNDNVRRDAMRTAVNMPIQGLASDVLMIALAIIVKLMRNKNYKSMFVNTVHDSLVLDYHPDERDELVGLCKDVMENVVDYATEFMPGLDFGWLKVPLKADVEYGVRYGAYGSHDKLLCDVCGTEVIFLRDVCEIDDPKYVIVECSCPSCQGSQRYVIDPLTYNAIHPAAGELDYVREQLKTMNYEGRRVPRSNYAITIYRETSK